MQIVDIFYDMARQQKLVKGFRYGKPSEKGAGSDTYPLTWVDDPISGQTINAPAVLRQMVNVDILGIPANDSEVLDVQNAAFIVGLSYVEYLKNKVQGFGVDSFSYITLREYYDDNAAGVRFTYVITSANPINRCGDFFDPTKEFEVNNLLPNFKADNPEGCAVFNDKATLPNFKI